MKVLWATTIAALCALSAGSTNAPLLDSERSHDVVIVAVTPSTEAPNAPVAAEPPPTGDTIVVDAPIVTEPADNCPTGVGGGDETTPTSAPTAGEVIEDPTRC